MRVLEVQGQSMWPYLRSGEFVTVKEVVNQSELQIGDVVLFKSPVDMRLHRYIGDQRFKGDNNLYEDQTKNTDKLYLLDSPKPIRPSIRRCLVLFSKSHSAQTFLKRWPAKLGVYTCGFLLRRLERPYV